MRTDEGAIPQSNHGSVNLGLTEAAHNYLIRASPNLHVRAVPDAQVAQSVEQGTENPRVGGSIPPLGTIIPTPIELLLV